MSKTRKSRSDGLNTPNPAPMPGNDRWPARGAMEPDTGASLVGEEIRYV